MSITLSPIKAFMYLAYVDDSGTGDKHAKFKVLAAVLVQDKQFRLLEAIIGTLVEAALPAKKRSEFQEFKAWELYQGCGIWDGVEQQDRFKAIEIILSRVRDERLAIIYGAIDKQKLAKSLYSSADSVDVCFQFCSRAADQWMNRNCHGELALVITDDCDKLIKRKMRESFRRLRTRIRTFVFLPEDAWHLHDEMYFGNSVDSNRNPNCRPVRVFHSQALGRGSTGRRVLQYHQGLHRRL